jgi:GNAT superfamily N-acetyltransferase
VPLTAPETIAFRDHCLALEDQLYAFYGEVTRRPWGLLVANPDNPTHHDANHARRLDVAGEEAPAVAAEIAAFYQSIGVTPRLRIDPRTRPGDLSERLVALGWKVDSSFAGVDMVWRAEPVDPPALPEGLRIGVAGPRDYELIARLIELDRIHGYPEYALRALRKTLGRPGHETWYLAEGGLAVACAELIDLDLPRVEGVLTHPGHRRRGYGRLLQRALQRIAYERGAPGLHLGVVAANVNAVALYRGVGYRPGPVYQVTSLVIEGGT